MRIAFLTLGCKVNAYETDRMKGIFLDAGYDIVSFAEDADIYLINTCSVTNVADKKSRQMIRRAARNHHGAMVVAVGCFVDSEEQKREISGDHDRGMTDAHLYIGNEGKKNILSVVEAEYREWNKSLSDGGISEKKGSISDRAADEEHTRAFIKVQDGCNQYCSYCIIPYVRGDISSRPVKDILDEVRIYAGRGVSEIVVTGIHLSSYGIEPGDAGAFAKEGGRKLVDLLEQISDIDGIRRIRLGSLEPRIINEGFVSGLAAMDKICPQFHLSLQSGSDTVLKRMNRHYTAAGYLEGVGKLRSFYDRPAITTDIIVGFPGETREEFEETIGFVRDVGFLKVHCFKYSMRSGTVAAGMDGQIPGDIKEKRINRLMEAGAETGRAYIEGFVGDDVNVLIEEKAVVDGEAYYTGYTERYIRTVIRAGDTGGNTMPFLEQGQIVETHVTGLYDSETLLAGISY